MHLFLLRCLSASSIYRTGTGPLTQGPTPFATSPRRQNSRPQENRLPGACLLIRSSFGTMRLCGPRDVAITQVREINSG